MLLRKKTFFANFPDTWQLYALRITDEYAQNAKIRKEIIYINEHCKSYCQLKVLEYEKL